MTTRNSVSILTIAVLLSTPAVAQTSQAPADAKWGAVQSLAPRSKVEVDLYDGSVVRGYAVEVTGDGMRIAMTSGELRLKQSEIKRVRVPSLGRRLTYGALGVGAGLVGGMFVCPSCANEGSPEAAAWFTAIGGGAGSLAFLIPGHRTVYKGPRR